MEDDNFSFPPPPDGKSECSPKSETSPILTETAAMKVADSEDQNGGESEGAEAEEGELADMGPEVTIRRKRGRPRKFPVEGNATLPTPPEFSASMVKIEQKRGRGRPPGTGKLQMLASLGGLALDTAGGNFIPYTIAIETGEDIAKKISSFAQRSPQSTTVLSATGSVSIVDIRPSGYCGSGVLRYEGQFEILTLSGIYSFTEMGGVRRKTGMLSVTLANTDGSVFGGLVIGSLIAAGPFQLILGSFNPTIDTPTPSDSEEERVQTPVFKSAKVEEKCFVTPSLRLYDLPVSAKIVKSEQNVDHDPLQSSDQNSSQPSDQKSDER